jgi:uncharacterized membrane protein YsdA (DUF1294 family)
MDDKILFLIIYGGYLILLSLVTFFIYGTDKLSAKKRWYRVPEKVLISLSIFGGAYGGIIGMKVFRHKTRGEHWYFTAINLLGIIVHSAVLVYFSFFYKWV